VQCGAPTSDTGPELASPAPHSSSPVELLPPPPIAGRAPPPPPATRESNKTREAAGGEKQAPHVVHIRGSRVEREYGGKGAPTPAPFFPIVIAGADGAAIVPLHAPFLVPDSFSGTSADSLNKGSLLLTPPPPRFLPRAGLTKPVDFAEIHRNWSESNSKTRWYYSPNSNFQKNQENQENTIKN
jgi:hypothetical protein